MSNNYRGARGGRGGRGGHGGHHHGNNHSNNTQNTQSDSIRLSVYGLKQSKATTNDDGGLQSLKSFLERKSGRKILNSFIQGDNVIVSVAAADEPSFIHLNGFTFAGVQLSVIRASNHNHNNQNQPPPGPRNDHHTRNSHNNDRFGQNRRGDGDNVTMRDSPLSQTNGTSGTAHEVTEVIASVIRGRYNAAEKYLTLESLAMEPQFQQAGISALSASKVYQAVFVTCETKVFETPAKRREMVESLSLSNNGLTTVKDVIAAASTFSHIKNLDLSNNNIADVRELRYWRNRYHNLEHIILSGNPIALQPETKDTMRRWYRNLKFYNGAPVDANSGTLSAVPAHLRQPTPPLPTASPVQPLPTEPHPEFPPDSTFGVAMPDKPHEVLLKEQMGLQFSFQTRLKMQWVEQCLSANNFDYNAALANLQQSMDAGQVPADAFLQV